MKKFLISLIIAFSIMFMFGGCCHTNSINQKIEWPMPTEPLKKDVESVALKANIQFVPLQDGIYLDRQNAENLLYNIDELDAYILKLNELIKTMKKYYEEREM